jgi:hypothetical protein
MKQSKILIVVNGTDPGRELEQTVAARMAGGEPEFKLLVPAGPDPGSWTFTRGETGAAAEERLRTMISELGTHHAEVRGEVTYEPAMDALTEAVARDHYDELILSTPSAGIYTMVRFDLSRRARKLGIPTTHIVSRQSSPSANRAGRQSRLTRQTSASAPS